MKRRKNIAAEVLNLYLSAYLDFFGDIFFSEAFTVTSTMRLPSERVMSEKEREPRSEY